MTLHYTGVGSRKTPETIQYLMAHVAEELGREGYILRSGGAEGADAAFEYGAMAMTPRPEIYRPQGTRGEAHWIKSYPIDVWDKALQLAASVHPAWDRCSPYARSLHARNAFQVLGWDLQSPSAFMICWTPDGASSAAECTIRTGGTGTAIRMADRHGVEVFNLQKDHHFQRIFEWVKKQGVERPLEWDKS